MRLFSFWLFHFSLKVFHLFSSFPIFLFTEISFIELFVRYVTRMLAHKKKTLAITHIMFCLFISMSLCPPTGDFNQSLNQIEIVELMEYIELVQALVKSLR